MFYGQVTVAHTACSYNFAQLLTASMVTTNVLHDIWFSDKWVTQIQRIKMNNTSNMLLLPRIYSGIIFDGTKWMEEGTDNVPVGLPWCTLNPTGKTKLEHFSKLPFNLSEKYRFFNRHWQMDITLYFQFNQAIIDVCKKNRNLNDEHIVP